MNQLFLDKLEGKKTNKVPVWFMRQAGRYMASYQRVRTNKSFLDLVKNPTLASEITLQPVRELDVDAAIIFSDILTIPEAMGLKLIFDENGPHFPTPLFINKNQELSVIKPEDLTYVYEAIKLTKKDLDRPLIGFSGAPFTLFAYMVEGKSTLNFSEAKTYIYKYPNEARALLEQIAESIIVHCNQQLAHGADCIQLFDSWAQHLDFDTYQNHILPITNHVISKIKGPVIMFAKGSCYSSYLNSDAKAISVDWTNNLSDVARETLDHQKCFQGNLDPSLLLLPYDRLQPIIQDLFQKMKNHRDHWIFNLGHGIIKETNQETVKRLVNLIHEL